MFIRLPCFKFVYFDPCGPSGKTEDLSSGRRRGKRGCRSDFSFIQYSKQKQIFQRRQIIKRLQKSDANGGISRSRHCSRRSRRRPAGHIKPQIVS
jgi:hypothetical protein